MKEWKKILNGEQALPDDPTLAKLYALSRAVRRQGEDGSNPSKVYHLNHEKTRFVEEKNRYSNQYIEGEKGYAQLSFISEGCKLGQCSFCNYGGINGQKLTPEIVADEMEKFKTAILAYKSLGKDTYSVLFDSIGSILDSNEFSPECLDVVFKKLEDIIREVGTIEDVSFETHYQTLGSYDENGKYVASEAIQKLIDFSNAHKEIGTYVIELGFETANSEIRDNLIFKNINENTYKDAIKLLRDNGIGVDLNVMATLPFLSPKEQIEESTKSVLEALEPYENGGYGADTVVLFPLNVRKNSFCEYVFEAQDNFNQKHGTSSPDWLGEEFPIWSMVATLSNLIDAGREDLLERVSISWFGGRQLSGDGSEIYPDEWDKIYDDLTLYRLNRKGENSRANIIKRLASHPRFIEFKRAVAAQKDVELSYHDRAKYLLNLVEEEGKSLALSPCEKSQ